MKTLDVFMRDGVIIDRIRDAVADFSTTAQKVLPGVISGATLKRVQTAVNNNLKSLS